MADIIYRARGNWNERFFDLFPEKREEGVHVRVITFIVTERCNMSCTYCVAAGTQITMSDFSTMAIENIKVGDIVLGFDETTERGKHKTIAPARVIETYARQADVIRITLDNGYVLDVTENHPILCDSHKHTWTEAGQCKIGQKIMTLTSPIASLADVAITNIEEMGTATVYNLATESRTYIANGFAVHNCYEHNKSDKIMSLRVGEDAVDFILTDSDYINVDNTPAIILEFMGGEPLLEIDLIEHIVSYFNRQAFKLNHPWFNMPMISISSNGLLYLSEPVQRFVERHRNRLSLGISIDGDKETHDACRVDTLGHGTYDRILPAVRQLIVSNQHSHTKVTFAHDNLTHISAAIMHLMDLGFTDISANVVFEDVWAPGDEQVFYSELVKLADAIIDGDYYMSHACTLFSDQIGYPLTDRDDNNWCGGNCRMLAIGTDGTLYPCVRFAPYSLGPDVPPLRLGDIYNGYTELQSPAVCELCSVTRRSQSTDECWNCQVAAGCAWCTASHYELFGTPNRRATYICKMHIARVAANVYYWRKLYDKLGIDTAVPCYLTDNQIAMITRGRGLS